MSKPLKFHHTLNQPPRSAKRGQHRRSSPPVHRGAVVGADHGAGGTDAGDVTVVAVWQPRQVYTWPTLGTFNAPEQPKPPAIPYAGIRTGELIGHRLWWVIRDGGEPWLCSLAHRQLWKPGETVGGNTKEIVHQDWFTEWTIWGGVYAFASSERLTTEIGTHREYLAEIRKRRAMYPGFAVFSLDWTPVNETMTFVAGTVKMWGEVVEHETGYRAQFAKLDSIDQIFGDEADIEELRRKYLPSFRVTGT